MQKKTFASKRFFQTESTSQGHLQFLHAIAVQTENTSQGQLKLNFACRNLSKLAYCSF